MPLLEGCGALNNMDLERELKFLASREKHNLAKLLAHLAEYDRRQLCVNKGHSTLFSYCVMVLKYDEGDAFRRIRAARVARRWPEVLELIESEELQLTALIILSPVLTDTNRKELFARSRGKSRRQLEAMVAELLPQPERGDFARRRFMPGGWPRNIIAPPTAREVLPSGSSGGEAAESVERSSTKDVPLFPQPRPWEAIVPISREKVRIGFDADLPVLQLLERARQVLRHKFPDGRFEDVIREALNIFLDRKDPQRRLGVRADSDRPAALISAAANVSPAPERSRPVSPSRSRRPGRYIPIKVRETVWRRDGGRCAWRFEDGAPCGSRERLEYDHVRPFARGGRSDDARNLRLLCGLHNRLAAQAAGLAAYRR